MIFVLMPGSCQRGGAFGPRAVQGVNKKKFKHSHVAYRIDQDDE